MDMSEPVNIQKDSTEPLYTLRVTSKLSSTPSHSIRQYIDKGLIIPFKTKTKRHLFSDVDILRLKCIKKFLNNQGLNIAGINAMLSMVPCWVIKPCTKEDRVVCDAYNSEINPCWKASNKGPKCRNSDCRVCEIYKLPEKCVNLKEFIKMMTNT